MRTPAALRRLNDVLPTLLGDLRVEVVFTVDGGSAFSGGLLDHLRASGALIVPWSQACQERFDLALAASDNSDLHLLDAPLVLMPHGAGYHRRSATDPESISGLSGSGLLADGRVVPHTVVVAHERQAAALTSVDPRLAGHTLVAADPCLDRITASAAHRHRYRRAFAADGRRMVLLCSTWGRHSLFGADPGLARRLVTTLPADEYRVAMTLHPNIWQRHGRLQVRAWLRAALGAGLALVPPGRDWRQAMVAADLVVSDHGSLTSYAAAAGKPVLLASDGGPEVVPGTPLARLLAALPRLPDSGFPETAPDPVDASVVDAIFHQPGTAAAAMNRLFYRIVDLPVPHPAPATEPIPVGGVELSAPTHYRTTITAVRAERGATRLALRRTTHAEIGGSLSVADTGPEIALVESASAVWADFPFADRESAESHVRSLLERLPGARLAAATAPDGTVVAALRDGSTVCATTTTALSMTTAVLHWWSTLPPGERPRRVEVDAGTATGTVEPR
ncbi:hypothetical protein [Actinokineospora globicatena]|uniref:CDP-Glycerol:Poly(Glycerophosphate) glycerophosphotransferase n=1 Tax=Actinokineospora globicatena TaxID=103729 RepID=A0A9W6QLU8_9PSEU|nr:hypothetical protein [Actinokineospora globicatena]GLW93301.1 hypothetical protein Aglo03_41170 [Actinokineospora globicatena]